MTREHLVRLGIMGHIGRFRSLDGISFPRGSRVIVRSPRGLEIAEVLAPPGWTGGADGESDGTILRGMTAEDALLETRLARHKQRALEACAARLHEIGAPAVLVDVEHLFDGRSLFFYFLGEITPEVESLTGELAELYETSVAFRRFSETLAKGCGPGCGTDEGTGGGCGSSCVSCSIAGACGSRD